MNSTKYDWLNKRYLRSVEQLRLWDENPRLNPDEKHLTISDFTEDLIAEDGDKKNFFDLLKSISIEYIPADPIVVWQAKNGRFYVAEGNRRVLALKLLLNPDKAPKSIRAYVRNLANNIDRDSIEKIQVNVAPTFEDAEWYINQRNSTSSLQRPWSRIQQQKWISDLYVKYSGDIDKICDVTKMTKGELENFIRVLHLLDLIKEDAVKKQLSEQELKDATSYKFPITILERFFGYKSVREQWGIDFDATSVKLRNKDGFLNAYAALIKNIVSKEPSIDIDTRTITTHLDEILSKLPKVNLEVSDEYVVNGETNDTTTQSETSNSEEKKNTKTIVKNDPNRDKLVLPIYQLNSSDYRLNGLFCELKKLGKTYINVKAASIRVFLDLAVANYIQSENIESEINMKYKCSLREVVLAKRLQYIQENKLQKYTKSIVTKLLDENTEFSLSVLNGYIHGQSTCYLKNDFVNRFWDFLFPLFQELLDIKENKE